MRIGFDGTPLLGERTGIGWSTSDLIDAIATESPQDELLIWPISWRTARDVDPPFRPNVRVIRRFAPARPLRSAWEHLSFPPLEFFTRCSIFHGTNFVVPPAWHIPSVVTVHDLSFVYYPELVDSASARLIHLLPGVVRRSAAVVCVSKYVQEELEDWLPESRGKTHVINQASHKRAAPTARQIAETSNEPHTRYILALGAVSPRKNIEVLLKAFRMVHAALPDVRLVLAGPPSKMLDVDELFHKTSSPQNAITITGYVDDLWASRLLNNASVLAFPSRYEGFGMPMLEAMEAGVPVVASTSGSLPEIGGDAVLYADRDAPDELAAQILSLLNDDSLRNTLIARGRERAQHYTWTRSAQDHLRLYRSLV